VGSHKHISSLNTIQELYQGLNSHHINYFCEKNLKLKNEMNYILEAEPEGRTVKVGGGCGPCCTYCG